MNKPFATAVAAAGLSLVGVAPASATAQHTTEDVTGEVFACANNTYTLEGEVSIVLHESTDAQGREHVTGTVTTTGVTAVDEDGAVYGVRGAQWFGGNETPNGEVETFTFHLSIVKPGAGVVDTFRVTAHNGPGSSFELDSSTCADA